MAVNLIYLGKGMGLISALLLTSSEFVGKHFYFIGLSLPPFKVSPGQQKFAELLCACPDLRHGDLQVDKTQWALSSNTTY